MRISAILLLLGWGLQAAEIDYRVINGRLYDFSLANVFTGRVFNGQTQICSGNAIKWAFVGGQPTQIHRWAAPALTTNFISNDEWGELPQERKDTRAPRVAELWKAIILRNFHSNAQALRDDRIEFPDFSIIATEADQEKTNNWLATTPASRFEFKALYHSKQGNLIVYDAGEKIVEARLGDFSEVWRVIGGTNELVEASLLTSFNYKYQVTGAKLVRVDLSKTLPYQLRQASIGRTQQQYELALRYLSGNEVEKDESKAREWLERAAAKGHYSARKKIEALSTPPKVTP